MESIGHSAESVAQAFVRAINRQDVNRLAELMAPNHRFIDSLGNTVEGREKMREGWAAYFRMVPDYSVAIEEFYPADPEIVMLGMASGTFTRDATSILKTGGRHPSRSAPRSTTALSPSGASTLTTNQSAN